METTREPLVSVIVVNYNGKDFLDRCLSSLLMTDYSNFEVILVDNGSSDGNLDFVKDKFGHNPRLKTIKNTVNLGFAEANNIGIRHAQGKYVVLLNNDTVVAKRWLTELVKVMENDIRIAAAQSKLLLMDHPTRYDCAGGFLDHSGGTYARGQFALDTGQYEKIEEIFACKGAAMILRRGVLRTVGLLDSAYFFYYEETDLCWRIWLAAYKVVFVPSSVVYHKGGGSIPKGTSQQIYFQVYLLNRNRIMTLLKNYEIRNLFVYLKPWLLLQLLGTMSAGIRGYRRSNELYFLASTKAILWNLRNLRSTYEKRLCVQKIVRKLPDNEVIRKMTLKSTDYGSARGEGRYLTS